MNSETGTPRKHLFIINPVSFRTKTGVDAFISHVKNQFETVIKAEYEIYVSRFPRNAIRIVWQYVTQAGPETAVRVYAVGGDGILFDCLNGLVGLPNAELAPVPWGRSNDFIRAFGEGLEDIFRNIPLLASAPVIPTDILHCGSNYALNHCLVGLESNSVFRAVEIQQALKTWPRFLRNNNRLYHSTYIIGGVMVLFDKKMLRQEYGINIDGEDMSGHYASINMANGPCYGGDKNAVVTAVPDDGFIDALLFKSTGTLQGMTRITPYTTGHFAEFPEYFTVKRGKIISIRSKDPLMICLDGDIFLDTNITVEMIKGAVKIVAPNNLAYKRRSRLL